MLIMRTELTLKNEFIAIKTLAVPVIEYGVVLTDRKAELGSTDTKIRKILTLNGLLHPRADVHRLYVPRRDGGRGLPQIESIVNNTLTNLATYLKEKRNLVYNDFGENKLSKLGKEFGLGLGCRQTCIRTALLQLCV